MMHWQNDMLARCCIGEITDWQNDTLAKWHTGKMTHQQNDSSSQWHIGKMTHRQNDTLAKWHTGKMTHWQNDTLAKWHIGKMTFSKKVKKVWESAKCCISKMTHWWNDVAPKKWKKKSGNLQNDALAKWRVGEMTRRQKKWKKSLGISKMLHQQNDALAKWRGAKKVEKKSGNLRQVFAFQKNLMLRHPNNSPSTHYLCLYL